MCPPIHLIRTTALLPQQASMFHSTMHRKSHAIPPTLQRSCRRIYHDCPQESHGCSHRAISTDCADTHCLLYPHDSDSSNLIPPATRWRRRNLKNLRTHWIPVRLLVSRSRLGTACHTEPVRKCCSLLDPDRSTSRSMFSNPWDGTGLL